MFQWNGMDDMQIEMASRVNLKRDEIVLYLKLPFQGSWK